MIHSIAFHIESASPVEILCSCSILIITQSLIFSENASGEEEDGGRKPQYVQGDWSQDLREVKM